MTLKRYQKAILITLMVLVAITPIAIVAFYFIESISYDHDYHMSVQDIAIEEYGCDRVICYMYCDSDNAVLPDDANITSREVCCIVAEKDGEEVMLFLPNDSKKENGFFAKWKFDYKFTEILAKMESVGIPCSKLGNSYDGMYLVDNPLYIDGENNLDSLDFPAYFQCYLDDGYQTNIVYVVAQKNHELKIYEFNQDTEKCTILC